MYFDGSFDYSLTELINFNIDLENLSMYPNPVQDKLNFNLKSLTGKAVNINIINNFGQVVKTQQIDNVEADNVQLSLDNVASGFYQVLIQVGNQKPITKKLIVEKLD